MARKKWERFLISPRWAAVGEAACPFRRAAAKSFFLVVEYGVVRVTVQPLGKEQTAG